MKTSWNFEHIAKVKTKRMVNSYQSKIWVQTIRDYHPFGIIRRIRKMGYMFDVERIANESGLLNEVIERIKEEVRKEFPKDEMMYELHLMRAIESEKNKDLSPAEKTKRRQEKERKILRSHGYDQKRWLLR